MEKRRWRCTRRSRGRAGSARTRSPQPPIPRLGSGMCRQAGELVEEEKWIAFLPFPEAMLAQVDLRERRVEQAGAALEHAFTIACQIADPCWEGIACRGLGLVEAARGRGPQALAWLMDGRVRCTRIAHPYQWIHGWVLDGMCSIGHRDERVGGWIDELESLASRTGML